MDRIGTSEPSSQTQDRVGLWRTIRLDQARHELLPATRLNIIGIIALRTAVTLVTLLLIRPLVGMTLWGLVLGLMIGNIIAYYLVMALWNKMTHRLVGRAMVSELLCYAEQQEKERLAQQQESA